MPAAERFYRAVTAHVDRIRGFEDNVRDALDDLNLERGRRRLGRVAGDIDHEAAMLAGDTRAFLAGHLPAVWAAGATAHRVGSFSWTADHTSALALLTTDTHAEVVTATRAMSGDVRELARLMGRDPDRAAGLIRRLRTVGITAVTASDGRRLRASTYIETVLATKTTVAFNLGGLNQWRANGVTLAAVSDGPGCGWDGHDDPLEADGLVVTVEAAAAVPLSHPNCRRDLSPHTGPAERVTLIDPSTTTSGFDRYLIAQPATPAGTGRRPRAARSTRSTRNPRGSRS
jgi:hypothetical protein